MCYNGIVRLRQKRIAHNHHLLIHSGTPRENTG
nr:MAG TPA: hypothetical protein [Caudoviricetes sp.]